MLRAPLAVRINDGRTDRHVSGRTSDLRFRKTAPGGHHSASMRIQVPLGTFMDLGPADKAFIYDARNGATIWDGYTERPGVTDGSAGQEYDITALGGMSRASDESLPLIYLDRDLSVWFLNVSGSTANAAADMSADPAGVDGNGLLCRFAPGQPIATNSAARISYRGIDRAGMEIAGLKLTSKSGKTDGGYLNELVWYPPIGWAAIQSASDIRTTPMTNTRVAGGGGTYDPPAGVSRIDLRLRRTGGATNIADDDTWTLFYDLCVLARRMNRHGTLLTGLAAHGGTVESVRADWVVEDLLGRVLTMCDPQASTIEAASWPIDQLAYRDGVKASQVLDDLGQWEPDMLWEILETTPAGLHRFNYRAWPTAPRYELSTADGYKAGGGDVDLCNRIAVNWTDDQGQEQTTVVTRYVEALGPSRIRDAEPVTLPAGQGSVANAQRIGEQVLEAKADPPKAATAVVDHPILDHLTGRRVWPWELVPGYTARVRETGDVLRVTEMEYVDADAATTLTLGTPALSMEQRVARLAGARTAA